METLILAKPVGQWECRHLDNDGSTKMAEAHLRRGCLQILGGRGQAEVGSFGS